MHLTGVFPTEEGASADHVLCDPEIVIVPAVVEDVHVHGPQFRWQSVTGEPSHTPAADRAQSQVFQGQRVAVWQSRHPDPGGDVSWTFQLNHRGHFSFRHSIRNLKRLAKMTSSYFWEEFSEKDV